jgi:hypothetical protein
MADESDSIPAKLSNGWAIIGDGADKRLAAMAGDIPIDRVYHVSEVMDPEAWEQLTPARQAAVRPPGKKSLGSGEETDV